jgi:hypothetical protein
MTRRNMMLGLMGLLVTAGVMPDARAQAPTPEASQEHKLLQKDLGVWDAVMKIWMQGPESDPITSQGVERNRPLGDFWVVSNYEGDLGGEKFAGHSQTGFDPVKKKFIGTWIDSMSPHLSQMEGTFDEATQELTMVMSMIDPATNQETKAKTISKHIDKDTRQFTMFMEAPGVGDGWVKSMEISYKRRPAEGKKQRE